MQLLLHDRAICGLHKRLLGNKYNTSKSIQLRVAKVTSDAGFDDGPYTNLLKNIYSDQELNDYYILLANKLGKNLG